MSNVGPVCHIPPASTPGNPQPLNMPGLPGPATDLDSAIALVNAMRLALTQMADQIRHANNVDRGVTNNFITQSDSRPAQWVEVDRQVQKVRVYQNNDKTSPNYVDVEQMNRLTMQDQKTGALWRWRRQR